jgi:hypothetical protein
MKLAPAFLLALGLVFGGGGCIVSSPGGGGGFGATTIPNTNPTAIIQAANGAFSDAGYSISLANYPESVSYDREAGSFGQLMYGSYGQSASYRATLHMRPVGSGSDYRVWVTVARVNNAGEAGFEDTTPMMSLWAAEFNPVVRQIKAQASNAGAM